MAAIPDNIKIKVEVDTSELDIALEKARELQQILEKLPPGALAVGDIGVLKQLGIDLDN